MERVKVSVNFIHSAHASACNDWKKRIEEELPDLFSKLVKGKWYIFHEDPNKVIRCTNPEKENGQGVWQQIDGTDRWSDCYHMEAKNRRLATRKEVERVLVAEARARGYSQGNYKSVCSLTKDEGRLVFEDLHYNMHDDCLYSRPDGSGGASIFEKGEWAEFITTMTIAEAEKEFQIRIKHN